MNSTCFYERYQYVKQATKPVLAFQRFFDIPGTYWPGIIHLLSLPEFCLYDKNWFKICFMENNW